MSESDSSLRAEVLAKRRAVVDQIERERGTKVITLIHRVEPWSREEDEITVEDSEFVLQQIRATPKEAPIDLIVHTPGGLLLAAEMIAMAVRYHPAPVTVMVPFYAMSGGTLIALAASEIRMERYSVLGPVDPQIAGLPSGSLIGLLKVKPLEDISDKTVILAHVASLALDNVRGFVKWLLRERVPAERAEAAAEFLTGGYLAHDTPITLGKLFELGLPVAEGVPDRVYELFETCAFGVCKRPCLASYDGALQEGRAFRRPTPSSSRVGVRNDPLE